jgi:hypothetical protein
VCEHTKVTIFLQRKTSQSLSFKIEFWYSLKVRICKLSRSTVGKQFPWSCCCVRVSLYCFPCDSVSVCVFSGEYTCAHTWLGDMTVVGKNWVLMEKRLLGRLRHRQEKIMLMTYRNR